MNKTCVSSAADNGLFNAFNRTCPTCTEGQIRN